MKVQLVMPLAALIAGLAFTGGAYAEGTEAPVEGGTVVPSVPDDPTISPEPDTPDSMSDTTVEPGIEDGDEPATDVDPTTGLQTLNMGMVQELQSLQLTGNADTDFATLMLRRIEQDMKLSAFEARRGKSRELRVMALRLYRMQRVERDRLRDWLDDNQQP